MTLATACLVCCDLNTVRKFTEQFYAAGCPDIEKKNNDRTRCDPSTVEPVYNGPVLSGHPLLAASFQSPDFSLIQTLYLLLVLGGHLY